MRELIDDYRVSVSTGETGANGRYDLKESLLVLKDAHNLLKDDDNIVASLKYLAGLIYNGKIEDCNIMVVSTVLAVPPELYNYTTVVKMGHLTEEEIGEVLDRFCREQQVNLPRGEAWTKLREKLIVALRGLSEFDILNILALAILDERELRETDTAIIMEQKRQMIEKTALLEIIDVKEKESDIGGLEELKDWLKRKRKVFADVAMANEHGVDTPKGVLITGMPGCGKSLTAKVTAAVFGMPLLKLDMGKVMGKYVGESEKNMRNATELSEEIAPCVLWIDELEKAFAGTAGEGGSDVTARLLGTFLTWLQEKKSAVFVVATANNASGLPPELLRKGRFDDIFYVDFPNWDERREIFKIHIKRRSHGRDLWKFIKEDSSFQELVNDTRGYSGADIEAIVREAFERSYAKDVPTLPTCAELLLAKNDIRSMSNMGDQALKMLSAYKQNRFRPASKKSVNDADTPKQVMRRAKDKFIGNAKNKINGVAAKVKEILRRAGEKDMPPSENDAEKGRAK